MRFYLKIFALVVLHLCCATVCYCDKVKWHVCRFDEIHKDEDTRDMPAVTLVDKGAVRPPESAIIKGTYFKNPLIFSFSTLDLRKPSQFCDAVGSKRKDIYDQEIDCKSEDILTVQKKQHFMQIVRSAMRMHADRLLVKTSVHENGFKVPDFTNKFCQRFTVPDAHKQKGVSGAETMLYVSSFPSSKDTMFAAGAPCARLQDRRPVVGALTYVTKHIAQTVYSVRVAAHEIAHALGFTYDIMKKIPKMEMKENQIINGKTNVTTLNGTLVSRYPERQFYCDDTQGIELEDEAGELSVPSRSHWERRIALEDLMAGIVTAGLFSRLTYSAFSDMDFYEVDAFIEHTRWGLGAGCDFLRKPCITNGKTDFPHAFCTEPSDDEKMYCAPGRRSMGHCSGTVEEKEDLPAHYQYFPDNKKKAGHQNLLTDRCSVVEEDDDLSCTNRKSKATGLKGPDSWCIVECEEKKSGECTAVKDGKSCALISLKAGTGETMIVQLKAGQSGTECNTGKPYCNWAEVDDTKYQCPIRFEVEFRKDLEDAFSNESNSDERVETPIPTPTPEQTPTPSLTPSSSSTSEDLHRDAAAAPATMQFALIVPFFVTAAVMCV